MTQTVRYRLLVLVSAATLLGACRDRETVGGPDIPEAIVKLRIDHRLQPYLDRYEAEAAKRGVIVDLSARQLTAAIDTLDGDGVVGECRFNIQEPNDLVIDALLWDNPNVSDLVREYIVYHELGHCERLRKHREDADRNNVCVSIMASGVGGCRDVYTTATRSKLLDELFDLQYYRDIE